ncbi:unnamed protein product, partial [Ixodes hexagonus]
MTTFTRSARWASSSTSSTENAPDRGVFKKPQLTTATASQRQTLRPTNKVPAAQPAVKQGGKLQRSSSLTSKCPEATKPVLRSRPTVAASNGTSKELPGTDSVSSLHMDRLSVQPKETPSFSSQLLLPEGVPDIDADDLHEQYLCAQYVKDIFDYLVSLEEAFPVHEQYLKRQPHITGDMRAILINWLMQVHTRFQLLPETLFLTVSVIDRFLQV